MRTAVLEQYFPNLAAQGVTWGVETSPTSWLVLSSSKHTFSGQGPGIHVLKTQFEYVARFCDLHKCCSNLKRCTFLQFFFFFSNTWLGLVEPEKLCSVCVCVCACVCVPVNARKEARVKSLASCCITPSHFVFQTLIEPGTHELVGWLATELQGSSTCPCPPNLLRLQMCPIQLLNWALQDPAPNL